MFNAIKRSLSAVTSQSPRTPERERLARAIHSLAIKRANIEQRSGVVAGYDDVLGEYTAAVNRKRNLEETIRQAEAGNGLVSSRGRASELLRLQTELDAAAKIIIDLRPRASEAEAALPAALVAETEAKSDVSAAEDEITAARDAVLFAELVKPELTRFERASRERNRALLALHAVAYTTWPRWGRLRFSSVAIYTAITDKIAEHEFALPPFERLHAETMAAQGEAADQIRERFARLRVLADRLAVDPDAAL